eukprot:TRINITY_DN3613_c0_g1_i1.p1 TRINITY_DN3613_c0_g1~~TRINITY_DN3613_c0_g1_i1.p1  ORF type:complete len:221 (+),score=20.74 TRINITY_DN3613_c0_g1_i1:54-716(+)
MSHSNNEGCPTLEEVRGLDAYHPQLPQIAAFLKKNVELNSGIENKNTIYNGKLGGSPCIDRFLARFCKYSDCEPAVFIFMVIYLMRFESVTGTAITAKNIHRLIISAFVVATKIRDDENPCNVFYSRLGGIPLRELRTLESAFLVDIDFTLEVSPEEFSAMERALKSLERKQPQQPERPPTSANTAFRRSVPVQPPSCKAVPCGTALNAVRTRKLIAGSA